ncbi:MAG: branched-chain amino acid ABC transporter substrate-binding protein [Promethearchaeota archaeon]
MKNLRMVITNLLILSVLILGFSVNCAKKTKKIKIGIVGALTGPQATFGLDYLNAAKLAVNEANLEGGVLGKNIELVPMDDKADPKEAVSVAHKLVSDPDVVAVVGYPNSGNALPASKIFHENMVPLVITAATNPKITQQGFENLFRICPTDDIQGPAAADFAINILKKKNFSLIHDKTAYGQGLAEEFKRKLQMEGCEIVAYETITEGERDFTAILTRIIAKNQEVIYFGGMYPEGGLLLKQAKSLGSKAIFIMPDGCFDPELIFIAGDASEDIIVSFLAPPWNEIPNAKDFVKKFQAEYGELGAFGPFAYDAVNVVIEAIRRTGKSERMAIIKSLQSPDFQIDGITGRIEFDNNGQVKNKTFYFYTVENKKFKLFKQISSEYKTSS